MNTIIALLMLVSSIIQGVNNNPNLPQADKDLATNLAHQLMIEVLGDYQQLIAASSTVSLQTAATPPVQQSSGVGVAAPVEPAPQFVGTPTATVTASSSSSHFVTFNWSSDMMSTSDFRLCDASGFSLDKNPDACVIQQTFGTATTTQFTIERPANAAEWYAIMIEANGQKTYYIDQIPHV